MSNVGRLSLIAGLMLGMPMAAYAQANDAALTQEVKAADAAYWKAYNSCDYARLDALTADNVEFYHDKGGTVMGSPMALHPLAKTSFFLKEMDVVVDFKPAVAGKSAGFIVRQNGAQIDEGVRQ